MARTCTRIPRGALRLCMRLAGVALPVVLAACTTPQEIAINGTDTRALASPSFKAFPLEDARSAVSASMLLRDVGSVRRYAILSGDRAPAVIEQRVETVPNMNLSGAYSPSEEIRGKETPHTTLVLKERQQRTPSKQSRASTWEESEQLTLRRESDGTLILLEVATPEEDSRSLFVDGLRFAAPTLQPNEVVTGASPMRVVRLQNGSARGEGTATRSLRLIGEAPVEVCGERLRASVLDLVFDVKLDVAKAHVEARLYVVEGRGIVAEERVEKVTILGIFPRTRRETVVLLPSDLGP